jgi:hypothetical protein
MITAATPGSREVKLVARLLCVICMGLLLLPNASPAASAPKPTKVVRFHASQDATVSSAAPDTNFGEALRLFVQAVPVQEAYVRFDLSHRIDPGRLVGAGITFLSPSGDRCRSDIRGVDIFTTSSDWSEDAITFNSRPPLGTFVSSAENFTQGRVFFDVTSDFTETKVATYVLEMPADFCGSSGPTVFYSSEAARSLRPVLEMEYCRKQHSQDLC